MNYQQPCIDYRLQSSLTTMPDMEISLINSMRYRWEQHVYWTRMLVISICEKLKDQDAVTKRLSKNPKEIADVFSYFYPEDITKSITQLLTEHLRIGAELITALRDGANEKANELNREWYINADKMAKAFSEINPYYIYSELKEMLYRHLDLTKNEVAMRLAMNYPADIEAFELVESEVLDMADYFTLGIIRQFPQKFN